MKVPLFIKESLYTQNNILAIPNDFMDDNAIPRLASNSFVHITPDGAIAGVNEMPLFLINGYARDILLKIDGLHNISEIIDNISGQMDEPIRRVEPAVRGFLNASYSRGLISFSGTPYFSPANLSGCSKWLSPRTCAIEITKSCDLRCRHCYADGGEGNRSGLPKELSTEAWLSIIDTLSEGCSRISITGGDPLVHRDFKLIASHAVKSGMAVTVLTNGFRIDNDFAKWFSDIGIKSVKLSLDGSDQDTHDYIRNCAGAFERAVNAIKILVNNGIEVNVGSVITEGSFNQILEISDFVYRLGARSVSFGRILDRGRASRDVTLTAKIGLNDIIGKIDEAMKYFGGKDFTVTFEEGSYWIDTFYDRRPSLKEYLCYRDANLKNCMDGCGAGSYMIFISSAGEVKPCAVCETVLGQIKSGRELVNVMQHERSRYFRRIPAPMLSICDSCEQLTSCLGCIAQGLEYSKRVNACRWKTLNNLNGVNINEFARC